MLASIWIKTIFSHEKISKSQKLELTFTQGLISLMKLERCVRKREKAADKLHQLIFLLLS